MKQCVAKYRSATAFIRELFGMDGNVSAKYDGMKGRAQHEKCCSTSAIESEAK